ncbi:MAG: chalcone isomerase family protein [Gammaproteobacteria bacterium]|nr:chalcone isomerase family protein [Gammaproteobacteria bacterium]MBU1447039.1 chalcone isomerase family protein [Gammaproteobacteria bacterium]
MRRIAMLGLLLVTSLPLSALELAGVKLSDTAQVGSQALVLNGAGVRTKWFFKVYVGALYLPQKQSSADMVIADEREHSIALHMLRDLGSKKLYGAFNEAIQANHTGPELKALADQLRQMAAIFDAIGEAKQGDVITLDYLPASGTQVSLNGVSRGLIPGAAFNRALLKIWLGSKPAQDDLKKAMLGG